jgi:hypothetical protein
MISNILSNWLKAVCDNGVILGSNLILYTVTAGHICTHSLKVPGYGVMQQIKILLTCCWRRDSVTSVVLGSTVLLKSRSHD